LDDVFELLHGIFWGGMATLKKGVHYGTKNDAVNHHKDTIQDCSVCGRHWVLVKTASGICMGERGQCIFFFFFMAANVEGRERGQFYEL